MKKFIEWFFSPSTESIVEDIDVYSKLIELEDRVIKLEEENVELTNELYRMENSLDARIDILASEPYNLDRFSLDK
jgi:hypothetical protein